MASRRYAIVGTGTLKVPRFEAGDPPRDVLPVASAVVAEAFDECGFFDERHGDDVGGEKDAEPHADGPRAEEDEIDR